MTFGLNIWIIFAMLLINVCNWMLPGIYTPTYEICSCTAQDYSQPQKFENTSLVLSLTTLLVFSFVAIQIHIYKRKIKSTLAPVDSHQILQIQFPNNLLADLTLTIGSVVFLMATFSTVYVIGSTHTTVDFNLAQFIYLLILPISFISVAILFYAKNANARKIIMREFCDSFINCYQ